MGLLFIGSPHKSIEKYQFVFLLQTHALMHCYSVHMMFRLFFKQPWSQHDIQGCISRGGVEVFNLIIERLTTVTSQNVHESTLNLTRLSRVH